VVFDPGGKLAAGVFFFPDAMHMRRRGHAANGRVRQSAQAGGWQVV